MSYTQKVLEELKARYPEQPEFIQAAKEVLTTLQPARYMNSVAIVSSDSGLGDALSTGVFCMPVEKGQALIEQLNDVEALWMLSDETMVQSSGWGK